MINTSLVHRHKLEIDWLELEDSFTPAAGEMIIYDPEIDVNGKPMENLPNGRAYPCKTPRLKIGDGIRSLKELPFVGANEEEVIILYCGDSNKLIDEIKNT